MQEAKHVSSKTYRTCAANHCESSLRSESLNKHSKCIICTSYVRPGYKSDAKRLKPTPCVSPITHTSSRRHVTCLWWYKQQPAIVKSIAGIDFCVFALMERVRDVRAPRKECVNGRFVSRSLVQKSQTQKKKKNQRRAHLQIKGQYFKEGEAFTKTFKCNNFLKKSHVFGHKSKK